MMKKELHHVKNAQLVLMQIRLKQYHVKNVKLENRLIQMVIKNAKVVKKEHIKIPPEKPNVKNVL